MKEYQVRLTLSAEMPDFMGTHRELDMFTERGEHAGMCDIQEDVWPWSQVKESWKENPGYEDKGEEIVFKITSDELLRYIASIADGDAIDYYYPVRRVYQELIEEILGG
jgi:hypothetical protein